MRPSRLLPALAAILIATAPVEAEDSGQGLLLPFGGAPSWILKPPGGPAPTIDMNFATGQYYGLQPSQLSVTRASPDNEVCNGTLYQFGNNVAPITPCGLWAWEARTNGVHNNTMVGAVAGTLGSGGALPSTWVTGTTQGLILSVSSLPSIGKMSCIAINYAGTPTSTGGVPILLDATNGISGTVGQVFSESVYLSYSGSAANISGVNLDIDEYSAVPSYLTSHAGSSVLGSLGPSALYQAVFSFALNQATAAYANPTIYVNVTNGQAVNFTLNICAPQMELNPNATTSAQAFATGPILTSGAAVTRAAPSNIMATVPVQHNANSFSLSAQEIPYGNFSSYPSIVALFDAGLANVSGILGLPNGAQMYLANSVPGGGNSYSGGTLGVETKFACTFAAPNYFCASGGAGTSSATLAGAQLTTLHTLSLAGDINGVLTRATVFGSNGLSQSALNYVTSH